MSGSSLALWIIIAGGTAVVVWGIAMYNGLVKNQNTVEDAWAGIESQLKKRHNLIPNLVETVKGYAEHEESLLKSVTELRTPSSTTGGGKGSKVGATGINEQALSQSIKGLMIQVEAYPDLKADGNFQNLQNQLSNVENDIECARRYYNGAVRNYNTAIQSFPSNLIAERYQFTEAEFFELDVEAARQAPKVDFS